MTAWLKQDPYTRLQAARMPDPPLYCTHCSAGMVYVERRDGWTTSGVPIYIPAWVCPKTRGFLNRLFGRAMFHDELEADVFGARGYWRRVRRR